MSTVIEDMVAEATAVEQSLALVQAKLAGWTKGNETNPSLDYMRADQARFYYPPIETGRWRVATPTTVGIVPVPANTWTKLIFNEETWNFTPVQYSTAVASSGFFSYRRLSGNTEFMIAGFLRWRRNSSGERFMRINEYTTGGVMRKVVVDQNPAVTPDMGSDNMPFCFIHHIHPRSSRFDFEVYQNGGASTVVAITFAYLGIAVFDKAEAPDSTKTLIFTEPTRAIRVRSSNAAAAGTSAISVRTSENTTVGGAEIERSFIKFNIYDVPSGADIISGELQGKISAQDDNTSAANNIVASLVSEDWTSAITYGTQPGTTGTMGSTVEPGTGSAGRWQGIPLSTALVARMISSNYGIRLSLSNEDIGSTNQDHISWYVNNSTYFDWNSRLVIRYLEE